ncbi:N-acetylmuramoyl-L-alanine amidase [Streptomyces sp. NPDC092296]|uniref:peptidoglycan recognition protein family protein n=1 Tax=Streptomyces sp. NPDC092296 TaxID=3366012 RepID=UPI0037FA96B3
MATPLTADRILAVLRAEGLEPVEHPGWRTHDRAGHGAWGPVHGVMIHHTGGTPPSDGQVVWAGRADLPGPCAHAYLAPDGTLTLTSAGRANHAGGGDPAVLAAVIAESYGDRPPATHQHEGSASATDGNACFYGLESSNLGDGKPWPAAQYDAAVRWAAALCRAHGWTARSCIGHKEWSDWKPDPTFDMVRFRADVAKLLGEKPAPVGSASAPAAPAKTPVVDLSRVVAAARRDPAAPQGSAAHRADALIVEKALQAEGLLDAKWVDGSFGSKTITAYAALQRRYGYTGKDADGIPGSASLKKLGLRNGFTVTQ